MSDYYPNDKRRNRRMDPDAMKNQDRYNQNYDPNRGSDYGDDWDDDNDQYPVEWYYTEFWMVPGPHKGTGPRNYQRSDDAILEDVCDRLAQHGQLDARGIEVSVEDGEVTLSGSVPDRRSKRLAEDIADSVSGVSDVNNQLHFQSNQSRLNYNQKGDLIMTNRDKPEEETGRVYNEEDDVRRSNRPEDEPDTSEEVGIVYNEKDDPYLSNQELPEQHTSEEAGRVYNEEGNVHMSNLPEDEPDTSEEVGVVYNEKDDPYLSNQELPEQASSEEPGRVYNEEGDVHQSNPQEPERYLEHEPGRVYNESGDVDLSNQQKSLENTTPEVGRLNNEMAVPATGLTGQSEIGRVHNEDETGDLRDEDTRPEVGIVNNEEDITPSEGAQQYQADTTVPGTGGMPDQAVTEAEIGHKQFNLVIGMEVVDPVGRKVGLVKEVRTDDFLVNRSMKRDIYVPMAAIQNLQGSQVFIRVDTDKVDDQNWPKPSLL